MRLILVASFILLSACETIPKNRNTCSEYKIENVTGKLSVCYTHVDRKRMDAHIGLCTYTVEF